MSLVLCLLSILLIPMATAGLALIQQGLGRSRSAAHSMLASLCALSVTAIVYVLFGSSLAGYLGGPFHALSAGGQRWDLLGAAPFFGRGLQPTLGNNPYIGLTMAMQLFAVGLASLIPISAGMDRWRLVAIGAFSVAFGGVLYPLCSHWVWGGGWISQLGKTFSLPTFVDAGGAGVVQVTGGLAALSVAWVLGPRQGKYADGMATAIPGHNIVLVLFGCLLALVGWIGLDTAGSMLYFGAAPQQVILIAVNALLAAAAGCLAAVVTTRIRYRKPDASLSANGWVAGLVASSAGCAQLSPFRTVFIGVVAGIIVAFLVETFELDLFVDDPGGAVSVHAGAGLWGLIAYGLLGPTPDGSRAALVLVQLIGVATLLGVMLPFIHIGNLLLNKLVPYRVDADGDWQGMDIRELGAGAYPEFVLHADEFIPR